MARRRNFDSGFGGQAPPTEDEVARIGSTISAISGQAKGYAERLQNQVTNLIGSAETVADGALERVGEALGDTMADAIQTAINADAQGQTAMVHALLPVVETAMSYGWQPGGAVGSGKGGKRRRKGKIRGTGGPDAPVDGPPSNPPSAPTPVPAGSGALPFDPAPESCGYADMVNAAGQSIRVPYQAAGLYAVQGYQLIGYGGTGPCPPEAPPGNSTPPSTVPPAPPPPLPAGIGPELPPPPQQGGALPVGQFPPQQGGVLPVPVPIQLPGQVLPIQLPGPGAGQAFPIGRAGLPPPGALPILPAQGGGRLPGGAFPLPTSPPSPPSPPGILFPVTGFEGGGGPFPLPVFPTSPPLPPAPPQSPSSPPSPPLPPGSLPPYYPPPGVPSLPGQMPSAPLPVGPVPGATGAASDGSTPCQPAPIYLTCPPSQITVQVPPCPACGTEQAPITTETIGTFEPVTESTTIGRTGLVRPGTAPPAPPPPPIVPAIDHGPIAEGLIAACLPAQQLIQQLAGKDLYALFHQWGLTEADGTWTWFGPAMAAVGDKDDIWTNLRRFAVLAGGVLERIGFEALKWTQKGIGAASGCEGPDIGTAAIVQVLIGAVRKWIAELPPSVSRPWDYYTNWACPVGLPGSEWANEARANNFIDADTWRCLVRANGDNAEYQQTDYEMRQERVQAEDLLLLRRKGVITTDAQFDDYMKQIGWTEPFQRSFWRQAQTWVPSQSDAVEWMLKDVQDAQIQETFLLGAEFQQKYSGHVKEVFDWQGIEQRDADSIWRAHWRNMSPHVLYEMHKRLRPGWTQFLSDEEVIHFVAAIAPRKTALVTDAILQARPLSNGFPVPTYTDELSDPATARQWLESLSTSGYHVSEALGQADYPPFWRQRLLAISYNVLTRVDMRRAYETGQISHEQLVAQLQDRGYTPTDAVHLAGFMREAAIQVHTRRPAANQWTKTGYDAALLKQTLKDQGMREDMWKDVGSRLEVRRRIYIQTNCIDGIKKRYLMGVISDDQAQASLLQLDMSAVDIGQILSDWRCLKRAQPKHETAQQICTYFKAGIIGGNQAALLLRGLGYSTIQARRILSLCYLRPAPKGLRHQPRPGTKEAEALQEALES